MMPRVSGSVLPSITNDLPDPTWPYEMMVALYPSSTAITPGRAALSYTSRWSQLPEKTRSK